MRCSQRNKVITIRKWNYLRLSHLHFNMNFTYVESQSSIRNENWQITCCEQRKHQKSLLKIRSGWNIKIESSGWKIRQHKIPLKFRQMEPRDLRYFIAKRRRQMNVIKYLNVLTFSWALWFPVKLASWKCFEYFMINDGAISEYDTTSRCDFITMKKATRKLISHEMLLRGGKSSANASQVCHDPICDVAQKRHNKVVTL